MTGEQKQKIYVLRKEKMTFAAIAKQLGIPVSTVKSFCWRNGLSDIEMAKAHTNRGYRGYCKNCGVELTQIAKSRPRLFCSDKCRWSWWAAHNDGKSMLTAKCPQCGETFSFYPSAKKRFCSHECYIAYRYYSEEAAHENAD